MIQYFPRYLICSVISVLRKYKTVETLKLYYVINISFIQLLPELHSFNISHENNNQSSKHNIYHDQNSFTQTLHWHTSIHGLETLFVSLCAFKIDEMWCICRGIILWDFRHTALGGKMDDTCLTYQSLWYCSCFSLILQKKKDILTCNMQTIKGIWYLLMSEIHTWYTCAHTYILYKTFTF